MFWSVDNEASVAVLQHLSRLRHDRYPSLALIGVHSPQSSDEDDRERVLDAIARYRLDLPVVHDPGRLNWARYNPPGWPSSIVVSKKGRAIGLVAGASDLRLLDEAIEHEFLRPDPKRPPKLTRIEKPSLPSGPLAWPSGVCSLTDSLLVVSDYGHQRLLLLRLESDQARLVGEIKTGTPPGPLLSLGDRSFAVSFPETGSVRSFEVPPSSGPVAASEELAAGLIRPQGLARDLDGSLVVAEAGADRLHRIGAEDGGPIAGVLPNGLPDGKARAAVLNQPTGVARVETGLAFTDTATSSVRLLTDSGRILTTTPRSSTRPGLVDGPLSKASLQRPRSLVALPDGAILIVDTGNSRLRVAAHRQLKTMGVRGLRHPETACRLPSGDFLVADTGNHRLVRIDPQGHKARDIELIEPKMARSGS